MKRIISFLICLVLVFSPFTIINSYADYNAELETKADIVLLFSLDDGTVIFSKNADKTAAPASLTKITTAILTIENCENLDTVITVPSYCITLLNGTGSSMAGLKAGEEVTVRQLLYCMLVKSANEAANILADYIGGGSIENFVSMMNDFAARVGAEGTHYVNAHGLDAEGQYTTANDLAKITKYALNLPVFTEICTTYKYTMPATNMSNERNFVSTNWVINPNFKTYYYEYVQGIKTGTTSNAGQCIITKASKDGYNYLCIVMGAHAEDVNNDNNPDNMAFLETKKLYKWVFENIRLEKIVNTTDIVTVVDVKLAFGVDHVRLVPANDVTALVPVGTDSGSVLVQVIESETPAQIKAPVKKGEVLGKAKVLYADTELATVDLVAAEDIKVSVILWALDGLYNIISSPIFIIIVAMILVVVVIHYFTSANPRRRK
ncbi:MAG: D-alanyl-D-alanine carboxypeptidase family protein, partial [Clostridiaceae bacterium]|nr:D-alanyl-D-alanine carboxypeptidase family protein [Clostridiaceae bacterium]